MEHKIIGKIFNDTSVSSLSIYIDSTFVYKKTFSANTEHVFDITFLHDYNQNDLHELIINFDSEVETQNKFIVVDNIMINKQEISIANSFYIPKKTEWWDTVQANEIKESKVYKHGKYFGWHGKIYFYYHTNTVKFNSWQNSLGILDKIVFSDLKKKRS